MSILFLFHDRFLMLEEHGRKAIATLVPLGHLELQ
jgi:hypothetical protein